MGAIIAILSRKIEDVRREAVSMLKMLGHGKADGFGLGSPTKVIIDGSIENLERKEFDSHILIGQVFSKILESDIPQPVQFDRGTLVFEGRIFASIENPAKANLVAQRLNQSDRNAETFVEEFDGSYAFGLAEHGRLIVGRDSLGLRPLYYGENNRLTVFASERKALWKIGIGQTSSFPPGNVAYVDERSFKIKPVRAIIKQRVKEITLETAVADLRRLLQSSVRQTISGLKETALAFSGGLDSSIIALLAKCCQADIHLIFVGLKNRAEMDHAEKAAEALELPLHIYQYDKTSVEKHLPRVLWLIEEANPVQASIGLPVFWTAENASKMGLKALLTGQGADELFAGYRRHLDHYTIYGKENAEETIFHDILEMHRSNLERDAKICNCHDIELRLPFVTHQLREFAVSLPLRLKISPNGKVRKYVLRRLAEDMGLPEFIARRPKRAVQYSTGVIKVLRRLSKQKRQSVKEYTENMFADIMKRMI